MLSNSFIKPTLHIGSANFGSVYGVSTEKQLPKNELKHILKYAATNNMIIDSAEDYPNSQEIIGTHGKSLRITTKIDTRKYSNFTEILKAIQKTKKVLKTNTLEILYVRGGDFLLDNSEQEKVQGLIEEQAGLEIPEIGFSIYEEYEFNLVNELFGRNFVFQVPFNLGNTTFKRVIQKQKEENLQTRFVARSVFLQGLLTIPKEAVPAKLNAVMNLRDWIQKTAFEHELSEADICLAFVANANLFQAIVIGVQKLEQLEECNNFIDRSVSRQTIDFGKIPHVPNSVSDPRTWNNL